MDLALKVRLNGTKTLLENECYIIRNVNVAPKEYSEQELLKHVVNYELEHRSSNSIVIL